MVNDRFTVNGITYFTGERYRVISKLSPYLFKGDDQLKHLGKKKPLDVYVGELKSVPYVDKDGRVHGHCFFFAIDGLKYHENYYHAEPVSQIRCGFCKIVPEWDWRYV